MIALPIILPDGVVTMLFADIEGSTLLLQELGDAYAGVLGLYRSVLRNAVDRHGGVEVDTSGDGWSWSGCSLVSPSTRTGVSTPSFTAVTTSDTNPVARSSVRAIPGARAGSARSVCRPSAMSSMPALALPSCTAGR